MMETIFFKNGWVSQMTEEYDDNKLKHPFNSD